MSIVHNGETVTKEEYKEIMISEFKITGCFPRFVNDLPDMIPYRRTLFNEGKRKLHRGQYKLYLSEVDFLTDYARHGSLVIYVGAATGHHINDLYDDFSHLNLEYHLYDTNLFDSELYKKPNIKIFKEYFTDEHCKNYVSIKRDILFVSDIRNMNIMTSETDVVPLDMAYQMNWVLTINPRVCMLKFRLPYSGTEFVEYLDGELRLQAYAPNSTTECRLVSEKPYEKKMYDPIDNENRMFYLNRLTRHWYDYDKLLEKYILDKYARVFGKSAKRVA